MGSFLSLPCTGLSHLQSVHLPKVVSVFNTLSWNVSNRPPFPGIPIPVTPIPHDPHSYITIPGSPSPGTPGPAPPAPSRHQGARPPSRLFCARSAPPRPRPAHARGARAVGLRKKKMAARSVCRAGSAVGRALLWGPRPSVSRRAARGQRGGEPGRASGRSAVRSVGRARLCPGREGHGDAAGDAGRAAAAVGAPGLRSGAGRAGSSGGCHCHPVRALPSSRCPLSAPVLGCDRFVRHFPWGFPPLQTSEFPALPREQSVSSDDSLCFYRQLY